MDRKRKANRTFSAYAKMCRSSFLPTPLTKRPPNCQTVNEHLESSSLKCEVMHEISSSHWKSTWWASPHLVFFFEPASYSLTSRSFRQHDVQNLILLPQEMNFRSQGIMLLRATDTNICRTYKYIHKNDLWVISRSVKITLFQTRTI